MESQAVKHPGLRLGLAALCLLLFLLLLAGAWSLPFRYPSESLFYKFGQQRLLLISGKLAGVTGGLLILVQLLAVAPGLFPEWLFSRAGRLRFHRANGLALLLLVCHPVLILGADDFAFYPLARKYLPEFVGMALLFCLLLLVLTAQFRARLPLSYRAWRIGHRLGALVVVALFLGHLLTVSETFRWGLPHRLALGLAGVEGFLLLLILGRALFSGNTR
jgi:predicted ferric reductase